MTMELGSIECCTRDAFNGPNGFGLFPLRVSLWAGPVSKQPNVHITRAAGTPRVELDVTLTKTIARTVKAAVSQVMMLVFIHHITF